MQHFFMPAFFKYEINCTKMPNAKHDFCVLSAAQVQIFVNSVVVQVDRFQSYRNFFTNEMNMPETEFTLFQSIHLDEISSQARAEAAIRVASADGDEQRRRGASVYLHQKEQDEVSRQSESGPHAAFHHHLPGELTCIRTLLQVLAHPRCLQGSQACHVAIQQSTFYVGGDSNRCIT